MSKAEAVLVGEASPHHGETPGASDQSRVEERTIERAGRRPLEMGAAAGHAGRPGGGPDRLGSHGRRSWSDVGRAGLSI